MGTETVPIVIGALVIIKKEPGAPNSKHPGAFSVNGMQMTSLFGTARILRKVLSIK